MTALMPRGTRWLEIGAVLALFLVIHVTANETDLATSADCYYNYNHYSEGDRILTNEPCLNCTCHNKMLMCYLKVCPFTKPIGEDCTVEKREDQCCPIITCPEVPVELDHSSGQSSTDLATHQNHGCSIDGQFYPEGAQIPGNPKKPCELCYCIRNMTSCVMQECTLHVDGCRPIYNKGVCCPVRYDCAHEDELPLMLEDQTTTEAPSQGFVITTTSAPVPSTDCYHNGVRYTDGENIDTDQPCEHCYCMRGDIVCAVQECKPLEMHGKNCTARAPGPGECCPQVYECDSDFQSSTLADEVEPSPTTLGYKGDVAEPILTTQAAIAAAAVDEAVSPSEHLEKDAVTTEGAIADATSPRIDESENEIHDKDYDHITSVKQPSRSNITAPDGVNERIEGEESTTLLSKLEDVAATTVLAESGPVSDEQITTVLPIAGLPQAAEKDATESQGILSNLYTTIKSIVDFTTTLSPIQEQPQKPHEEEEFLSNVIPGEGDCLDNGVSYANNTNVPTRNVCEESCLCYNSIVRCESVKCAPMPPNAENCRVIHEEGLCCPSYHCESMEFSTGTPPTHPAESQVVHRDGEPQVDSTTLAQSSEDEEQTNAVDSKLDSTTIQSAKVPISSKLDDTFEVKPEIATEKELAKETPAPELESSTEVKQHDELPSDVKVDEKLDTEPEQPVKEEIATEAATEGTKYEPESTTLAEVSKLDDEQGVKEDFVGEKEGVVPEIPAEIEQVTTQKAAEQEQPESTAAPVQHDEKPIEESVTTELPVEKLHDEIAAPTEIPSAQDQELEAAIAKAEIADELVTTERQSEASVESQEPAKPTVQVQDESVTTELPSGQKTPQFDEISTEAHLENEVPTEEQQKEGEISTEQAQPIAHDEQKEEISTEAHRENEISTEGERKESEISTESGQKESELKPEDEISTEQAQPIAHDEQKPEEFVTTELPAVSEKEQPQQQDEISTESQKETEISTESQKTPQLDEISTETHLENEVPTEEQQKEGEISTEQTQPIAHDEQKEEISTEAHRENEISTEGERKESEISTESQPGALPELVSRDEIVTTEGAAIIEKAQETHTQQPEVQSQDEYVTTEQAAQEPSSSEEGVKPEAPAAEEQPTTQKSQELEQPAEDTTTRIAEAERPVKLADEVSSTEKQAEEEYTEKATENLIPDSSTDGHVEKQHDEISTEKHVEPAIEQISTEKAAAPEVTTVYADEKSPSDDSLAQTTLSSVAVDSKLSDELQPQGEEEQGPATGAPKPSVPEADATERLPEYNEIPLESDDHKTEKDIIAPATETQQTVTEHIPPQIHDEQVTEGVSSTEGAQIAADEIPSEKEEIKPEISSTEQAAKQDEPSSTEQIVKLEEPSSTEHAQEEQTTLSTSKLSLSGISPSDFKEGEVVSPDEKQEFEIDESGATTTEKLHDEIPSGTESSQPEVEQKLEPKPEQKPELISSEGVEEPIATEQPAVEQIATEQPAAIPSHDEEITQEPAVSEEKEQVVTEKQATEEASTIGLFPSKQEDLDIITEKIVPSKQEDLEISTVHHEKAKEEPTTALYDESVEEVEKHEHHDIGFKDQTTIGVPSRSETEIEATTLGKISEEEPPKPAFDDGFELEQHVPPAATEKRVEATTTSAIEHDEQTTYGITEKSTESSEIKHDEPLPTEVPVQRPDLESGTQMHIDKEQPQLPEVAVTTEAAKQQDETVAATTVGSVAPSLDGLNRIGEDQTQETASKAEEPQPVVTEGTVSAADELPKEDEQLPPVQLVSTEQTVVDVTTLLNKIHDESVSQTAAPTTISSGVEEITTQRQEQPELPAQTELPQSAELPGKSQPQTEQPQQQTEQAQQQPTEQPQEQEKPEIDLAPVQHDEKPIEQSVTTEQAAIEAESTTLGIAQPAQSEETLESSTASAPIPQEPLDHANRISDVPSEQAPTGQPQYDEVTQSVELGSSSAGPAEAASPQLDETTVAQVLAEEERITQRQEEGEKVTESQSQGEAVTQKDEIEPQQPTEASASEAPIEISSQAPEGEKAEIVPEITATEQEAVATSTSEPVKSDEPEPSIAHDELPGTEVTTEQHIDSGIAQDEVQATPKPSILEGTTIKSVVELITTLHPFVQQEADVTTVSQAHEQPIYNRVDAEGSSAAPELEIPSSESSVSESKPIDDGMHVFATPPESANKIPLIREPSVHPDELTTKLAESFDTTTLPSILLTSSHTERISDSTTIKNTQNEITEPTQPQISGGSLPEQQATGAQQHEPDAQQPSYPSFDSGYGNVPSQYPDEEYTDEEEPAVFGPGTCRYGGKLYVSAQQIPRDDPCDFCFCFRSDIICLQQSCPPPITGCHEEPIQGFCCPRYECPVSMGLSYNTTTTTTTTLPPYLSHFQRNSGKVTRSGCQIQGISYKVGERVTTASGPCIDCICGGDGQMKCDPKVCTPEPMLRQMIASAKRR